MGAVAKRLGRQWIGIEKEPGFAEIARRWIEAIVPDPPNAQFLDFRPRRQPPRDANPPPVAVRRETGNPADNGR